MKGQIARLIRHNRFVNIGIHALRTGQGGFLYGKVIHAYNHILRRYYNRPAVGGLKYII